MCTSIFLSNKMERNLETGGFIFRVEIEGDLQKPFVNVQISDTDQLMTLTFAADPETLTAFAGMLKEAASECAAPPEAIA